MSHYEIDLLTKGSLSQDESNSLIKELIEPLKSCKDFKEDKWGKKETAYKIGKETSAHYYILTFETDDISLINELRRLSNLNDKVLRCLIINIEKTYGYNAVNNPKKQKHAELINKKYQKYQKERENEWKGAAVSTKLDLDDKDELDIVEDE